MRMRCKTRWIRPKRPVRLAANSTLCGGAGCCHFTILAVGIGVGACRTRLLHCAGHLRQRLGEPFSLTTGTSAWPGEILRFAALALAISFIFQLYHSLRTMIFQLTRHFRLPLVSDKPKIRQPISAVRRSFCPGSPEHSGCLPRPNVGLLPLPQHCGKTTNGMASFGAAWADCSTPSSFTLGSA